MEQNSSGFIACANPLRTLLNCGFWFCISDLHPGGVCCWSDLALRIRIEKACLLGIYSISLGYLEKLCTPVFRTKVASPLIPSRLLITELSQSPYICYLWELRKGFINNDTY